MQDNADFGKTAQDYRIHRLGFPEEFFVRLDRLGIRGPDIRVLDLGTGTGTLARGFASRRCRVTAVDKAASMLEASRQIGEQAGLQIEYRLATAEDTGLESNGFDVVVAGQAWHWFDRPRAAREVHRLLRPGGKVVLAHFDWIPLPGNVVEATEQLILAFNSSWSMGGGSGLYPEWLEDLALAGFVDCETFSFDHPARYSHESWRGRVRASAGVTASLPPGRVREFDNQLRSLLLQRFAADPLLVPHRVWAAIGSKPTWEPIRDEGSGLTMQHLPEEATE